jgi:integrase-like protein
MITPVDKVQASYDPVSTHADLCRPPRNVPALRAVPHPGKSKQEGPAPSPSRVITVTASPSISPTPAKQPKLLDRLCEALRSRHYSRRTEQCYCHWVKRFIFFHMQMNPDARSDLMQTAGFCHHGFRQTVYS